MYNKTNLKGNRKEPVIPDATAPEKGEAQRARLRTQLARFRWGSGLLSLLGAGLFAVLAAQQPVASSTSNVDDTVAVAVQATAPDVSTSSIFAASSSSDTTTGTALALASTTGSTPSSTTSATTAATKTSSQTTVRTSTS
jgi:hypothetical protein